METTVVNITNGEAFDSFIGRPGPFGNPFVMKRRTEAERNRVCDEFRKHFYKRIEHDADFLRMVLSLKGKRLGCYCLPLRCHGETYVEFLNAQPESP